MGYDLFLRDPVTREKLRVPGHLMHGANFPCEEAGGRLTPSLTTMAYLDLPYKYSHYYDEAFPDRDSDPVQNRKDAQQFQIKNTEGGIRSLDGLSGQEAVPLLQEMIRRIETRYRDIEGWIDTERDRVWYTDRKDPGNEKSPMEIYLKRFELRRDGMSDEEAQKYLDCRWEKHESRILVSEGDTRDYWQPTAANALRPLYQLIALSRMRPDGVWSEES